MSENPFYWTAPQDTGCAPSGWYQWTKRGLVYLGDSILEPMPKYLTAGNEALKKLENLLPR